MLGVVAYTYNPSPWKVEVGEPKLKATLGYMRDSIRKTKQSNTTTQKTSKILPKMIYVNL